MDREMADNLLDPVQTEAPMMEEPSIGDVMMPENTPAGVTPTADIEAEKALLSLCLNKKKGLEQAVLKRVISDDFADSRNGLIYEAIMNLYINSGNVDRITVTEELERIGRINAAGGANYVYAVANSSAVLSNVDSYIDIVHEKSKMRSFINAVDDLKKKSLKGGSSVNDLVDIGVSQLTDLREAPEGEGFEQLGVILHKNLEEIHSVSKGKNDDTLYKSGFRGLDNMLGGFRAGTLNIIAARPGMGKTALVINIATNIARMYHKPVNIFSLEMSKAEIGNRIIAASSSVTAKKLQRATISPKEERELMDVLKNLNEYPIYIDDRSSVTPTDMMSSCKDLKSRGMLGLIIVDYLQLMNFAGGNKNASRQEVVSAISRSLKVMAKDLNVPIIALSQLSRGSERRGEDHTPMLSDLRDSGAIEQDADAVLFIDRPDYYKKDDAEVKLIQDAKLIIAKNRHGEVGNVPVKWWGEKTLFFEENRKYDPVDPQESGTQSKQSSSANYVYDDPVPPPEEPSAELPFDPAPEYASNNDMDAAAVKDEFFADSNTGFPEGFD